MESVFQALIALLVCFFIVYVLSYIKKSLFRALCAEKPPQLIIAVRAEGKAENIAEKLREAEKLRRESSFVSEIVFFDGGAIQARSTAERLIRGKSFARIEQGSGENLWKTPSTPE